MPRITVAALGGDQLLGGHPFDRAAAARAGLDADDVSALVGAGVLRQPVRGVYLDARAPDDVTTRAACVALRLPPDAVVGRLTAAWLWGVDGRMPEQRAAPPVVECVVPVGRQPLRWPGVRCFTAPLTDDVCEVDGIPVTTPLRTALDLLRWLPPHMGLAVADALAAASLLTPDALMARAAEVPGVRGIAKARHLAALVEYDGEEFHSTPGQVAHDRRRREELERRFGWQVLAVGKGEVLGRSLALERGLGELLGLEPRILRRAW